MVRVPSEVSVHFISWLLFSVPPQVPLSTTVSLLLIAQTVSTIPSGTVASSITAANRMDRIRFFTETPPFLSDLRRYVPAGHYSDRIHLFLCDFNKLAA